ncbi:MAG: aminodeoxychorismate synthase component I [Verrucomicrobiota bacterium]
MQEDFVTRGSPAAPFVCLRNQAARVWNLFGTPDRVVCCRTLEAVLPCLAEVERATQSEGFHAAGFVAYEAAPAFDPALPAKEDPDFPLLWFALYPAPPAELDQLPDRQPGAGQPDNSLDEMPVWRLPFTEEAYLERVKTVLEYIRRGDTYQVNLTHRLRASTSVRNPWPFFCALAAEPAPPYGGFVDIGDWVACSASPEQFFKLDGNAIESRPMKGTIGRGRWFEQDEARAAELRASEKDRAENLMIVDMVRNDLGRIAHPGTVVVPRLFDVERYPTVWQMTSTVTAETDASLVDIFRALFPPASITGAPKRRTMQIIDELESTPRRIYTGAIGWIAPRRQAQFSVAIRTPLFQRRTGTAEYGVGGGIVWDSKPAAEARECRVKTRVLHHRPPPFELLETLRWTVEAGYDLEDLHLQRLANSAQYFEFHFERTVVAEQLHRFAETLGISPARVRLTMNRSGECRIEARALPESGGGFQQLSVARAPIDPANVFLYHKTTHRAVYRQAVAQCPGAGDVLLFNDRGEVTESTIANLALEIDGTWFTPPVECGLLPGTMRRHLLENGTLVERILTVDEVLARGEVLLFNSVRGLQKAGIFVRT